MDILVNVSNQKLKLETNLHSLVEGSQKFVRFVFDLSSEWDGLLVFAQFTQNGNSYNQYLDDNNCVYLPAEIIAGECTVMLYGSGHTVIGTTNYLTLHINDSILVSDAESTDITESLYNQLVSMVLDMDEKIDKKQNTWFATCSSPAYGSKEATTTTGDFVLAAGNSVRVHFSTSNYATNPTLNVDGTGAVDIRSVHTGVPWAGALPTYTWGVGEVVDFVYDGTYFVIVDGLTATDSIYGVTKLSTSYSSTDTNLAATPYAVKKAYDLADSKVSDVKVNGSSAVSGRVANVTVPTATSDLTNDSNFVSDADYVHTDNNYTDSDASKLNGISEGATATSVTQRLQSGTKIAEIDVDGVTTDIYAPSGGGGGGTQNIWYATCSTSYSTTAKIATTTSGDFVLATGNMVRVRFTDHNQNSSPTLNVDGTGATAIRTTAFTSPYNQLWTSGEVVDFVYDGTYFIMSDGGKASTSVYGVTKLSTSTSSTDTDLAATPSAVKAAYDLADSKVSDVEVNGTSVVSGGVASVTVPTVTSDLTNDSNFVSDASYVHTDNNFTNADATKLSGIEAGAEVNVQSDWTQADSTADDYIKNKPTIPTVNDGTLTIQQNGSSVGTFSANQSGNSTANITVPAQNIWYGTCDTGISTAGKVVTTTTGDFTLATGNMVRVKFNNYNTESSPTLNVDNTGTVSLKIYGTTDSLSRMWRSGEVVDFVYDGTYFVMSDGGTADTNYYGVVKLASSVSSNSTSTGANSLAVKTAYDLADSKSTVSVTQTLSSGTKIGDITVDGTTTNLYAPSGGSGGVSDVLVDNVSVVTGGVAEIDLSDYVKEDANGDISVTGGATFGYDVDVNGAVNSENLPGIIKMFAGTFAPTGWLLCNGDEVAIEDYPFLYDVIGDTYGTPSDSDHFVLPDLRGRMPLGSSNSHVLGSDGGSEYLQNHAHSGTYTRPTVEKSVSSADSITGGSHSHALSGNNKTVQSGSSYMRPKTYSTSESTVSGYTTSSTTHTHSVPKHAHTLTGGGYTVNGVQTTGHAAMTTGDAGNMPPFLTINYIISTGGVSRWADSAGLPIVRDVTLNGQSVVNNEIASIPTGTVYQFGWNKTSAGGTGTAITGEATLPAGTYIIVVQAPVISATTTMQIQGISDKYFTASHNHETSSWVVTFNTATAIQLQMAQSGTVTFSYTERGGMKAIRIA